MNIKNYITREIGIVLLACLVILAFDNSSLLRHILEIYPSTSSVEDFTSILSLILFFSFSSTLFLVLVAQGKFGKWILSLILIISAAAAHYMDSYGIVIDVEMIRNIVETDKTEIAGILNFSMISKLIYLGFIPAAIVIIFWRDQVEKSKLKSRAKISYLLVFGIIISIAIAPLNFRNFVREHKITRLYANPTGWVYSSIDFFQKKVFSFTRNHPLQETAADAKFIKDERVKKLAILIVGETARADRFSLNGYTRLTNPELLKHNVVSFSNVTSCGTSTSYSVPCMFSALGHKNFSIEKAKYHKNALDVLSDLGVKTIWLDNNSDSKGVALRIQYENFRSPTNNPVCDKECRDVGMLANLDSYIAAHKDKDILVILHQMGNHGPEYYRRYPDEFEYFKPVCKSSDLRKCTVEEMNNGYDNAIRYTDFFISQTIDFLKKYEKTHSTAMLYVSDHGESLGENGVYLHAAARATAPKEQTHVPAILWLGDQFKYKTDTIQSYRTTPLKHEDLYCTLLIAFEIKTKTCESKDSWLNFNELIP